MGKAYSGVCIAEDEPAKERYIFLNNNTIIRGKKPQSATKNIIINFDCKFRDDCKKTMISNQNVLFQVLGQKETKKANISMHYFKSE